MADTLAKEAASSYTDAALSSYPLAPQRLGGTPPTFPHTPYFVSTPFREPKLIAKRLAMLDLGARMAHLKERGWVRDDIRQWRFTNQLTQQPMLSKKELGALVAFRNGIPPTGWCGGQCKFCKKNGSLRHMIGSCPQFHDFYVRRHNSIVSILECAASHNGFTVEKNHLKLLDGKNSVPDLVLKKEELTTVLEISITASAPSVGLDSATRKILKYQQLCEEMEVTFAPLIFSVRTFGYIMPLPPSCKNCSPPGLTTPTGFLFGHFTRRTENGGLFSFQKIINSVLNIE
jgi:hypothetical protein